MSMPQRIGISLPTVIFLKSFIHSLFHMLLSRVGFQNSEESFFLTGNLVLSNTYKTLPLAITLGKILHIKLQGSRQRLNMVSF